MTDEKRTKLFQMIGNDLKALSIFPNIKGYNYLREIILLGMEEDIFPVTKIGYPSVARKYQTTAKRVERAMRHALEVGMERTPRCEWIKLIGNSFTVKLTNSEFISLMVEKYSNEYLD